MFRNHIHLSTLLQKELNALYLTTALRAFAISIIGIFVPIYMLTLEYTLTQVIFLYIYIHFTEIVFAIPAAKIAGRCGFKHLMFFSIPLLIIFYMLLYTIDVFNWPLWFVGITLGISNIMFWLGYHIDFSKNSHYETRGKEIGWERILATSARVTGPFIGGILITFFGFHVVFIIVCIILLTCKIPLFFTEDFKPRADFSYKQVFKNRSLGDFLAFTARGFETGISILAWPVFIFFTILGSFTTLGFVSSLAIFSSLLITFIISRLSDINRNLVLRSGIVFNSVVWIGRMLVKTPLHVYIVDAFHGASTTTLSIPFQAKVYDKTQKADLVRFMVFREMSIHFGRVLIFVIMLFVANLQSTFILGALAGLLYFLF